mmetsp:Transcript_47857/g.35075  ORF Transcript_47857/g.35075 Transcript_47857/m.35075 type:complete len:97 (+) Transcript_47857:835-1125(+)
MGDLVDDLKMSRLLIQDDLDAIKLGFYNNLWKDGEENMSEYVSNFDVVMVDDADLSFASGLIKLIGQKSKKKYLGEQLVSECKDAEGKKYRVEELI